MTEERRQRILAVAAELEAQGLAATNSAVYARVLGHRQHTVAVMKARRAERAAAGGVAVMEADEAPETETPAAEVAEDLQQLEHAYEAWHASLEQLWAVELDGPLSEAQFSRKSWLEYQMVQNLRAQEQLRPQLDQARIREAVHAAQAQHDAPLAEVRALAEQALHAVAAVAHAFEDLSEGFARQVDAFFPFRDLRGHQAFDVADGPTYALQLFQQFYGGDPRARDAYLLIASASPTMGQLRAALEACPRLQPFSPRAIATYLESLDASTPHREGTSNGSHP